MTTTARHERTTRENDGNRIIQTLLADARDPIRVLNMHGFLSVAPSTLITILLMTTLTRPHRIMTLQPICNVAPGGDVAADVLISTDTEVDAEAELRDDHLSGGRLATNGWSCSNFGGVWPINKLVTSRFTVYKWAFRNNTIGTVVFDCNMTVQLL